MCIYVSEQLLCLEWRTFLTRQPDQVHAEEAASSRGEDFRASRALFRGIKERVFLCA